MVHMLVGIQGSGKTTFALQLQKELNCDIASTDYVRKNYKNIDEKNVFSMVYELCAKELKNNKDIIYDATNITPKVRKRFFDEMVNLGVVPLVGAYYFDTDVNECFNRVKFRNTLENELYLPEEVVFSYHQKLIKPTFDEGFKFIKIVKEGNIVEVKINEEKYSD